MHYKKLTALLITCMMAFAPVTAMASETDSTATESASVMKAASTSAEDTSVLKAAGTTEEADTSADTSSETAASEETSSDTGSSSSESESAGSESESSSSESEGTASETEGTSEESNTGDSGSESDAKDSDSEDNGSDSSDSEKDSKNKKTKKKKKNEKNKKASTEDEDSGNREDTTDQKHSTTVRWTGHEMTFAEVGEDWRYEIIDAERRVADESIVVYEEMDEDSTAVGKLQAGKKFHVLSEEADGWYYVESGKLRGFAKSNGVSVKKTNKIRKAVLESMLSSTYVPTDVLDSIKESFKSPILYVSPLENDAVDYKEITARQTGKRYAIALDDINILEETDSDSRVIGTLEEGAVSYVVSNDGTWLFVESGDSRGFVKATDVLTGKKAKKIVEKEGLENCQWATTIVSPEENDSLLYSVSSPLEKGEGNTVRQAILATAASCIGNPYLWGGTSLVNGCDCSGFVQTIYARYGISLPRTSAQQSKVGTRISPSDAKAGDLLFYANSTRVYHVAIADGKGGTIEAQSEKTGIVRDTVGNAAWAMDVIGTTE